MNVPSEKGSYVIVYSLNDISEVRVGSLGKVEFNPGIYFYCGSAFGSGGLASRIYRHISKPLKQFWHVDYLSQVSKPLRIWFTMSEKSTECSLVRSLDKNQEISPFSRGFGSSDCKEGCFAHLLYGLLDINLHKIVNNLHNDGHNYLKELII